MLRYCPSEVEYRRFWASRANLAWFAGSLVTSIAGDPETPSVPMRRYCPAEAPETWAVKVQDGNGVGVTVVTEVTTSVVVSPMVVAVNVVPVRVIGTTDVIVNVSVMIDVEEKVSVLVTVLTTVVGLVINCVVSCVTVCWIVVVVVASAVGVIVVVLDLVI